VASDTSAADHSPASASHSPTSAPSNSITETYTPETPAQYVLRSRSNYQIALVLLGLIWIVRGVYHAVIKYVQSLFDDVHASLWILFLWFTINHFSTLLSVMNQNATSRGHDGT
jgi:hypothetical protein